MSNNQESLVNLSLLESIRQTRPNNSYLDYFVLLMLSLLPKKNEFTNEDIQKIFSDKMLIDIPIRSINKISNRAIQKGYFKNIQTKDNTQKKYGLLSEKVEQQNKKFIERKTQIKDSQDKFYQELKNFIFKKYNISLDLSKCKKLFEIHFLKNYKNIHNIEYPKLENIYNENYIVNDFIFQLYKEKNEELLNCMGDIIRGNWFANYLFMWGGDSHKKNLSEMTVFLDTPLIISLLGFHGKLSEKVVKELVKLLNQLKAKVFVFPHNLEETQSVLRSFAKSVKTQNFKNQRIEAVQEIFRRKYSYEQLEDLVLGLKGFLNGLSIKVKENPLINKEYRIDEKKLENSISHEESDYTGNKVYIDIKSAQGIFALRKGQHTLNISDKPSIFVSSSYRVVSGINHFFKTNYPEENPKNIPIFTKDDWLTNLCWISNPKQTTLPRDFLVANSYASLNEDSEFWELFTKKLNLLEKQGKVTEEGLLSIRYERDLKYCVEERFIYKEDKKLTENEILSIIDKAEKRKYANYEKDKKKLTDKDKNVSENIKNKSDKLAKWITIASMFFLVAFFLFIFFNYSRSFAIFLSLLSFFSIRFNYKKIKNYISKKIFNYFYKPSNNK